LIILDVMLPEMDGLTVCRKLRESSGVPIIMLTARGDVADRIVNVPTGGDSTEGAMPLEPIVITDMTVVTP